MQSEVRQEFLKPFSICLGSLFGRLASLSLPFHIEPNLIQLLLHRPLLTLVRVKMSVMHLAIPGGLILRTAFGWESNLVYFVTQ